MYVCIWKKGKRNETNCIAIDGLLVFIEPHCILMDILNLIFYFYLNQIGTLIFTYILFYHVILYQNS